MAASISRTPAGTGIEGLTIRPARQADVASVLELWRLAGAPPSSTEDAPGLGHLLAHDPDALLVAERDEELVGSVIAAFDGWRGALYRLAVLPRHRRRGVGRALVAAGEHRLRARGVRRIGVLAIPAATGAAELWDAVGYEPDPRVVRLVKDL